MNGAGEEGEGGDVGKHFTVSWSLLNAHCPIFITLWGIVTEVNARQSPNAISPIRVTPSCMVTEVKALQVMTVIKSSFTYRCHSFRNCDGGQS